MAKENTNQPVSGLGLILLLVGVVWLGKEMGWIPGNLPLLPITLIIIGLILIFRRHKK